jgi:hypothetical protein
MPEHRTLSYEVTKSALTEPVARRVLRDFNDFYKNARHGCRALPACAVEPRAESDLKEGPVGAAGQVTRLQTRSLVL